jgi:hypothetical protein
MTAQKMYLDLFWMAIAAAYRIVKFGMEVDNERT